MKFVIVLTVLFWVSAISAAPTEEPTALAEAAANYARQLAKDWEQKIPGWDSKASLRSNLLALLSKPFDTKIVPEWNPDISARENVEKYFGLLDVEGLDRNKTVVENMGLIVRKYFNKLPIPSLFPKSEIEKKIVDELTKYIKEQHIVAKIDTETINQAVQVWLDSLNDVKDPKDFIKSLLDKIFAKIPFSGLSGDKTLEELVVGITEFIFSKIDL